MAARERELGLKELPVYVLMTKLVDNRSESINLCLYLFNYIKTMQHCELSFDFITV